MLRRLLYALLLIAFNGMSNCAFGQEDTKAFRDAQMASPRVAQAMKKYYDSAGREFKKKNMPYPAKDIFLRAFKSQNDLELWARVNENSEYRLIKTFRICSISGKLGPKRGQGDRQVPEGFYFIDEFNTNSDYLLSLKLNYPNFADQMMGKGKLGGDIYIHGGCVTIGCLPMNDEGIKELYIICLGARLNGQMNIPVHVYPTRLTTSGMAYLKHEFPKDQVRQQFWSDLKIGYDYFEKYHKLLPVTYSLEGWYVY